MDSYFLVCVNFALVAKDVTATLQHKGLGEPLVVQTPAEALAVLDALRERSTVRIAVVQMRAALFQDSPLCAALAQLGVPVILLDDGPAPAVADGACRILSLPFFTEDLDRLLAEIVQTS